MISIAYNIILTDSELLVKIVWLSKLFFLKNPAGAKFMLDVGPKRLWFVYNQ